MSQVRFRTTLQASGANTTGIEVPDDLVEALGAGKRPPVRVQLGSHQYDSTIARMGGRYLVSVSAENRTLAGVAAGDEIDVTLTVDTSARTVALPDDLAAALAAVPGGRARFDALAPSHRKEHVRAVEEAKKPETRQRRIAKVVEALST